MHMHVKGITNGSTFFHMDCPLFAYDSNYCQCNKDRVLDSHFQRFPQNSKNLQRQLH